MDLSIEFKQANLATLLNEMLASGVIIQVKDTFRLPYKEK